MKWIKERDENGIICSRLEITYKEFLKLLPIAKKKLEKAEKQLEKYKDLLESGEATDKQTDKLYEAQNEYEYWSHLVSQQ
jgi:hypothetical protein